jgi:uncharacterized protein (TIGR02453 family)
MPPERAPKTAGAPARFTGWPVAALEFFDHLAAENTRAFWLANKVTYETKVLAPMVALLAELAPDYGEGRVFRPYRDIRFSKDKSPYKTSIAAHNDAAYISLDADALGVGGGLYMPSADQLARFRSAVDAERTGAELAALVDELDRRGISVSAHEVLKTTPRGYARDHPRLELLRHKGLTAWQEWPVGPWLGTAAAKKRIVSFLQASAPLRSWLDRCVGPAQP